MNSEVYHEEWRPTRYLGYEVSNTGKFRSYWTPQGLDMGKEPRDKSIIMNSGRLKVNVHTTGKNHLVIFCRIVAEAFLGDPSGKIVMFHDGNPANCKADNLYYVDRDGFWEHVRQKRYLANGDKSLIGKRLLSKKKRNEKLARALLCQKLRKDGKTYREIANEVGLSESGVFRIVTGSHNQTLIKALAQ